MNKVSRNPQHNVECRCLADVKDSAAPAGAGITVVLNVDIGQRHAAALGVNTAAFPEGPMDLDGDPLGPRPRALGPESE